MLEGLGELYMVFLHILFAGKVVWERCAQPSECAAVSWFVVFVFLVDMFFLLVEKVEILVKVDGDFFFSYFFNRDCILVIVDIFLARICLMRAAKHVWPDVHR